LAQKNYKESYDWMVLSELNCNKIPHAKIHWLYHVGIWNPLKSEGWHPSNSHTVINQKCLEWKQTIRIWNGRCGAIWHSDFLFQVSPQLFFIMTHC
jgi:hypothetical protein